jgi:hypothetical protein
MSLLYEGASATNGFDSLGHFARFEPLDSSCTDYVSVTLPGCSANFSGAQASSSSAAKPDTPAAKPASTDKVVAAAVRGASGTASEAKTMTGLLGYLMGAKG